MIRRLATIAAALALSQAVWADVGLQSGAANNLPALPAGNYFSNYYIDVPAGAQQLAVNLNASGGDVDLFVRFGSPFPVQNTSVSYPTVSYDLLSRYGQYHSGSSTSNESVLILPSDKVPLQTGRWYIALINGGSSTANGTLTASYSSTVPVGDIALDFNSSYVDPKDAKNNCDISFWTDSTPATPIGGNNGTTLGQQRQNALAYAANELVAQLGIPTAVTVQACGAHLGGDNNSATLAHAGATNLFFDDPQNPLPTLPKKYTWYPATAATRLSGTGLCGLSGGNGSGGCLPSDNDEIQAVFNMDVGTASVLNGQKFYLGFDPNQKPAGQIDFIHIAMHEMTHGLGFLGLVNTDSTQGPLGAKAGLTVNGSSASIDYTNLTDGPFDDIFDDSVSIVANAGTTYTPFAGYEVNGANDAARAAAMVSGGTTTSGGDYVPGLYGTTNCGVYSGPCTGLRWSDAGAANSSVNQNVGRAAPADFPSLYAPCDKSKTSTCAEQNGSTLSHTVQAGDMMNAYDSGTNLRNMGLAVPMLGPIGWSNAAAPMPTWGQPIPSNWYDVSHSGHGFDFQLGYHDAVNGDVYVLTFYSYAADGAPEWYQAVGHLVDGVFLPAIQSANGSTLLRVKYASNAPGQLGATADTSYYGSVVVDFNQAANSPVCRNVDRSQAPQLAVMYWVIGTDATNTVNDQSASWCMQPIVPLASHATPDYNGHWYAGSADSGWGFELLDVNVGSASPAVFVYMYYPGPNNQPTWAAASGTLVNNSATMQVVQIANGYCRTCTPPAGGVQPGPSIGSMRLTLNPITAGQQPTGIATFQLAYPGGGAFTRNNVPIQMLSVPTGR
ncbi:MAG: hypothetical protein KGH92_08610 [Xanthomonadaceae bacterium]|nr:hypothetical protein [Xanthomonadaceae bacterium]